MGASRAHTDHAGNGGDAASRGPGWRRVRGLLIAIMMGAGLGCGASYQSMYEGEVRFEHCYRLDEEPTVPLMLRRECWREWNQFYTYGQSRDRIEYAKRREYELATSNEKASVAPNASSEATHAPLAGPAPTSAFEPPPKVHVGARETPTLAATEAAESKCGDDDWPEPGEGPPGQMCLLKCAKHWKACKDACQPTNSKCKPKCDVGFRACVPRCV
jgi:hypothetical protein